MAGLEALIALRALARERVAVTLVSADEWFVDRPVSVAEPFGLGSAARYPLPEIAAELDAEFVKRNRRRGDGAERQVGARAGRTSASTPSSWLPAPGRERHLPMRSRLGSPARAVPSRPC